MEVITSGEYKKLLKEVGISYLGATKQSAKMMASFRHNVNTYCVYLAPYNLSGRNVCPMGEHCAPHCLNESGHNKIEKFSSKNTIEKSRIKKTNLFYDDRETFMKLLIYEIAKEQRYAISHGMDFAVRLNGTSDLSPVAYKYNGMNILEIFPTIQFYDYTKVPNRFNLLSVYQNYDITFSFDGYNWDDCEYYLKRGGKVAVVFESKVFPTSFKGFPLVDAHDYDMRYLDPKGHVCWLPYHPTTKDYVSGKYVAPDTPFVIKADDPNIIY